MPTTVTVTGQEAVIRELTRATEQVIAKIGLNLVANLKASTPVDTGWARANWIPSLGSPAGGPVGSRTGVTAGPQAAGTGRLASYKLTSGSVFVSNNVPYIGQLDAGSSQQAPAGFVGRAVQSAASSVGTLI